LIRTRPDADFKTESTGDVYTKKVISPEKIEILGNDNQWHPISRLKEPGNPPEQEEPFKLPPQPRLPDEGTYPAIKTDDGGIYFDKDFAGKTHVMFAKEQGIPPERIVSGGWLKDGDYQENERSDVGRWGEQARAAQRAASSRQGGNEVNEAVGLHEDDLPYRAKYQDVDWSAQDLQDSDKKVNENTIRRDYANNRKDVSIYKAYIPMEDMPSPKFPQGDTPEEELGENFDREDYRRPRVGVPVKVSVLPSGELQILDGNHRVQVWGDQNQQYAPAWVVDYRGPDIESLSDSEKEERNADRGEVSP
jgi:hypothetical protein